MSDKYGSIIELVKTDQWIGDTVSGLLRDVSDGEWIFRCIDEIYVVQIAEQVMNQICQFVAEIEDLTGTGVLFFRRKVLFNKFNLRENSRIVNRFGQVFLDRRNLSVFWAYQVLCAGTLRAIFDAFPDRHFVAREMD